MSSLIKKILENKQSVREIIDENVIDSGSLGTEEPQDDNDYRHLFIRRWHENDEKPYKRSKVTSALEALNLYFDWADKYKHDKVEIWSDVAQDAKNFYRFCIKNREMIEDLWKQSMRSKKSAMWPAAYRDIQARSRQSGENLVGTLYPFNLEVK